MEIQLVNTYFKDRTLNNCNMERELCAICTLTSTSLSRLLVPTVRLVWIRRRTSPRRTVEAGTQVRTRTGFLLPLFVMGFFIIFLVGGESGMHC